MLPRRSAISYLDESQLEIATVDTFRDLGYDSIHGPQIASGDDAPERQDYCQVILVERLHAALYPINPDLPEIEDLFEEAVE